MSSDKIYNIRYSIPFWDTLANIYLSKYAPNNLELASVLFLVPNRRACKSLSDAFIRQQGLKPAILPQIVSITEIDDDELFFDKLELSNELENDNLSLISKEERLFIFTRLILSKPQDFGIKQISLAQAFNLAKELANLIDIVCNNDLSFDKLQTLVPEKYATHWQETLELLKIITEYWPKILAEKNAIDITEKRKKQLLLQADIWEKQNTNKTIVAAGITASFPAIVKILNVIKKLPNGAIYFAGIDYFADDNYWNAIDEANPQFELKELLSLLDIKRCEIQNIGNTFNNNRELLISEIMRPAGLSDAWRHLKNSNFDITEAIDGIEIIETKSQRDEALAIAFKMREIIETPEKTVALITYDRNLARRVSAELERFNVKVDDSAGIPLNLTSTGIFLRLIVEAAINIDSDVAINALVKCPFSLFGEDAGLFRKKAYKYETSLRTVNKNIDDEDNAFISGIKKELNEFSNLLKLPKINFYDALTTHIKVAEKISSSNISDGASLLWKGDEGKHTAKFLTSILNSSNVLGDISGKDYLSFFSELMSTDSLRSSHGSHPRLKILGPIEARLNSFDYIILGEMNEGIWPKADKADMWMSRPMKKDFGLSLPEKNVGILASDLCSFLGCKNVILTRADRIDGTPTKKSRWLLRFETVINALGYDISCLQKNDWLDFINNIDIPSDFFAIKAPAPCPPIEARPRKLSASAVDLLVSDPYSVFAKYILRLYPFDDLDTPLDQRDYGTLIHAIIEEFNNRYPSDLPDNALEKLLSLGKKHFDKMNIESELRTFWFPKFEKTAKWIIEQEKDYRRSVRKVNNEITGQVSFNAPNGPVTFTAKADRIDELKNNNINIIDYKTGKIPSKKQVFSGHALQVVLEGLIARKGSFDNISSKELEQLLYWQLGAKSLDINPEEDDIIDKTEDYLLKLISAFDFETTPYLSRPSPKYVPKNKDYEHLARVREWSVQDDGEGLDE